MDKIIQIINENTCYKNCDIITQDICCHKIDLSSHNIGDEGCKHFKDFKCHTIQLTSNIEEEDIRKHIDKKTELIRNYILNSDILLPDLLKIILNYLDI